MGTQVAALAAAGGFRVAIYDPSPAALARAPTLLAEHLAGIERAGLAGSRPAPDALASIDITSDLRVAAEGAVFVSESIPERPALKRRFYRELAPLLPPEAIVATNSSTMLPSLIAAATGRPARFAALHFHAPIWETAIVDVMGSADTAPETLEALEGLARLLWQRPIRLARERAGYVFNSIYMLFNYAALELAARGDASIEDIDAAWKSVMRGYGPFEYMDIVGLDTVLDILELWARRFWFIGQIRRNAGFVRGYVERGRLGRKSGAGFYEYSST